MRQAIIHALVAAVAGGGAVYGTHKLIDKPIQYVQLKPSELPPKKATMLIEKYRWAGLEQAQIDAITKALEGKKLDIAIFCLDDARCGDLALDFDNAFESAHLKSTVVRPFIDDTHGVATSSQMLADVIATATDGKLKPKIIPPPSKPIDGNSETIPLVIGEKS